MEFQNAAVATSDLIDNKIADKITKTCIRIIQNRLEINLIKKYLKKDIYPQIKSRKLLMIWH